jgi:hypothetical protein
MRLRRHRGRNEIQERTMSVLDWPAAALPTGAGTKSRLRQKPGRGLRHRDRAEHNPYSPVACLSLLLIAGLVIEIAPAIHGLLAQHW